jgi:sugar/nucleoside kinase (ribokinase family)
MKVCAMTVACEDIYVEQGFSFPGGNALNYLTCAAAEGIVHCAYIGAVGNDRAGEAVRAHMKSRKIDISRLHVREGATASNRIYISKSGERYFMPDSWSNGVYGEFRLDEDDWRFAAEYNLWAIASLDPNFGETLVRKTDKQILSVDFLDTKDIPLMRASVRVIDILFASADDACVPAMREIARETGKLLVPTLGDKGSVAFCGDDIFTHDPIPVSTVVDTTGCGDSFQAAFCISYRKNRNIPEALAAGSRAAARVLDHFGGW